MVLDADEIGGPSTAENDARFTKIGRFIRKYKFDEMPQFFNVLKGDMSIIGPRPQVKLYTDLYSEKELDMLKMQTRIADLATIYFSDMDQILGEGDVDKIYRDIIEPEERTKVKICLQRQHEVGLKDIY